MKGPKWIWLLIAVVLAAVGAVAYTAANLNAYLAANREAIAERASRTIGRPVRFDGLELSVGRGLGIAVQEVAVGEDPRFGASDFLTARTAFVQVRILPALFGRYEVARISLESPTISLVRTAQGLNLEAMSVGKDDSGDAPTAQRRAIAIALLDIEDGTVRYVDRTRQPVREIAATHVAFHASDLSFGDALRFELSAAVLGAPAPNLSASGAVGPVDPQDVAATPIDVVLQLDDVDGGALQAAVPTSLGVGLEGPMTAKLDLGGTIALSTLNFVVNPSGARLVYGRVYDKPRGAELTVSGHLERRSDDTFLADAIDVVTASSTLTIRGTIGPAEPAPAYALTLSGTGMALSDWASALPALRTSEVQGHADIDLEIVRPAGNSSPTINGRIGIDGFEFRVHDGPTAVSHLTGVLSFKRRSVTLAPTDLRVGGTPARLGARVDDIFAPVVAFEFSSPTFPLSVLMQDANEDALEGLESSGQLSFTEKAAALEAQVRANSATIRGLPLTNLRATIVHRNGSTRIDPITFDSCGGSLRGALAQTAARESAQPSRVSADVNAERVNVSELSSALSGVRGNAPASGTLTFNLVATGNGNDWSRLLQALEGSGRFDIANGAILGVNVPEAALERLTGLPGLSALLPPRLRKDFPTLFGLEDTRFDALGADFHLANGRLQTQDLAVKSRDFAIDAGGTLGLDLGVDLSATLTTSQALSNRLVSEVAAMRLLTNREGSVTIPFRLVGGLPALKPQPDLPALTGLLQRGLLDTLGEKILGGGTKPQPTLTP
jgi:hypothetical protein